LVASYRGLAISTNPGIQSLQNPAEPRNSLTPLVDVGGGIVKIVYFMASVSHLAPSVIR
jgi:hypothetical protein